MPFHQCDTCGRNYGYKRNLASHVKEKHAVYQHWNCVKNDCKKTFVRRSTLSFHLSTIHGYTPLRAREFALRAPRGDVRSNVGGYYSDVSDDDTVFDIIQDIDEIRSIGGGDVNEGVQYVDLDEFDLPHYKDDITVDATVDDSKLLMADGAEKSSVIDTGALQESEMEAISGDETCDSVGDSNNVGGAIGSDVASASVGDSNNVGVAIGGDVERYLEGDSVKGDGDSDSGDGFETGDEWKCDFRESDYSANNDVSDECNSDNGDNDGENDAFSNDKVFNDGNGEVFDDGDNSVVNNGNGGAFSDEAGDGDDSDNDGGEEDDDDVILISSDDELAVERSQAITKTQTFVLTFRQRLRYLNGHVVSKALSMEKEYYEHFE